MGEIRPKTCKGVEITLSFPAEPHLPSLLSAPGDHSRVSSLNIPLGPHSVHAFSAGPLAGGATCELQTPCPHEHSEII